MNEEYEAQRINGNLIEGLTTGKILNTPRDKKEEQKKENTRVFKKKTGIPLNVCYYLGEKTLARAVIFINNINVNNFDLHILVLVSTVSL